MSVSTSFYENRFREGDEYGASRYDVNDLFRIPALAGWAAAAGGRTDLRFVDVGSGKNAFVADVARFLATHHGLRFASLTGVDLMKLDDALAEVDGTPIEMHYGDFDGKDLPLPSGAFHLLSCNHVMEHIFHNEKLFRELRRVLHPGGMAVVSCPNIAAWINRAFMLFAGQPVGAEIGTESITYGLFPRFLQPRVKQYPPAGHIRFFTPRGLQDLAEACGFRVIGWWNQDPVKWFRLTKWAGRNMGVVLRPV
jgi:SAM-dependent methyltransferase